MCVRKIGRKPETGSQENTETKFVYYILALILVVLVLQWIRSNRSPLTPLNVERVRSQLYALVYISRIQRLILTAGVTRSSGQLNISNNNTVLKLPLCDSIPPNLDTGQAAPGCRSNATGGCKIEDIILRHPDVKPGGNWRPRDCVARHRIAIVIPYRDRYDNLVTLLDTMVPMLKSQNLEFQFYIVEQAGDLAFNRAKLMNIGFIEALKERDWDCFAFHDVDLIPEDPRNMYSCPDTPRHMSVSVDTLDYRLPYDDIFGGASVIRTDHFIQLNGFSNSYWGWGGEDDDFAVRLFEKGFKISRPPYTVARYKMDKHVKRAGSHFKIRRGLLYNAKKRIATDGINSIQYRVTSSDREPLYTRILTNIGDPPDIQKYDTPIS